MGLTGGCTAAQLDTEGQYASVVQNSADYPTYTAQYAACKAGTPLNATACCPAGTEPDGEGKRCLPESGLYAYHDGSGDFYNHF